MMMWLALACARTRVEGAIAGEVPPVSSSMFYVEEAPEGDRITVLLSSEPNACRLYEYYLAVYADSPTWRGHSIAWQKAFPATFWELTATIVVEDSALPVEDLAVGAVAWNASPEAGQSTGSIVHFLDHPDPNDPAVTGYAVGWSTDGGEVRVDRYDGLDRFVGEFTTVAVDPEDGTPRGDLTMFFDATICPNIAAFGLP